MLVICIITSSQGESNYYVYLQIPMSPQQSNAPVCQSLVITVPPMPYPGWVTTGFIFTDKFKRALPVKTKPEKS